MSYLISFLTIGGKTAVGEGTAKLPFHRKTERRRGSKMMQAATEKDLLLAQLLATAGVMCRIDTKTIVLTSVQQRLLRQNLSRTFTATRTVRLGRVTTNVSRVVTSSSSIN